MIIKSDGGSSAYYKLPTNSNDIQDLVEYQKMDHATGECFLALYRMGIKEGVTDEYNWRKIHYYASRKLEQLDNVK